MRYFRANNTDDNNIDDNYHNENGYESILQYALMGSVVIGSTSYVLYLNYCRILEPVVHAYPTAHAYPITHAIVCAGNHEIIN